MEEMKNYKRADLHMHSTFSDGTKTPKELVRLAKENGVELISLTDHDVVEGLSSMRDAALRAGIDFVNGIELSAGFADKPIHVVGLGFDETNPELLKQLEDTQTKRKQRAVEIGRKLEAQGFKGIAEGVYTKVSNPSLVSRSHFAAWMLENGCVKNSNEAFMNWLNPGAPGYVPIEKISVPQAVELILGAGGIPVLAHPGRYKLDEWKIQELINLFKEAGGVALEVTTGSHNAKQTQAVLELVRSQRWYASTGSDYHYDTSRYLPGLQGDLPSDLMPVWTLLGNKINSNLRQ